MAADPPTFRINPAFHRWSQEAAIIGRILAAFGEIEYQVALCASHAMTDTTAPHPPILRALYRLRSTSSRIDASDAFMRPVFVELRRQTEYEELMKAVKYCLRIRNQFSHCNWADDDAAGLFFVDLEDTARNSDEWDHDWRHVDVPLLAEMEEYFVYAQDWLYYLDSELMLATLRISIQPFAKPRVRAQPPLHNPQSKHLPPWLGEDQRARFLERSLARERGDPIPTPRQRALEGARAAKRAKKQADRDRDVARRSTPPRSG